MLLLSYDISDDKLRAKFSKFLSKFGRRLQFSVYEIKNSDRVLRNINIAIQNNFAKKFGERDSVIIFKLNAACEKIAYGYAKHDESNLLVVA
ncbi:MAG: CRISPR-associated endonuclease Cas2 [Helicobacteraceae bacterium]|jgi:CRISPR-associated protein Cas2|nr:CRISPR-associated endonuclease Cas2 [Helicobacteraceae bacterium]